MSSNAIDFFKSLKIPVIQAPMAGGINNPKMASETANAGGVGSFGFAYSTAEKIDTDLNATRALTNGPINANFFVFEAISTPSDHACVQAIEALRQLPFNQDVVFTKPLEPYFPDLDLQIEPIWHHRPALLTFHFGIPSKSIIDRAKSHGILTGVSATSVSEGLQIRDAGIDFIIAQGVEAGGHRGIFNPDAEDQKLSTKSLLDQLLQHIDLPIVAAGGIMSPQDVRLFIEAGATAVQMGTAFLTTQESTASPAHKEYLLNQNGPPAVFTKAFSGRYAQGVENEFMLNMEGKPVLPFPIQNTLTGPMRQKASKENQGEYQSLWCGKEYKKCKATSIAELMKEIQKELG